MRDPKRTGLGLVAVGKRAGKEYLEDDMPTYAAALAYHGFLALFPFCFFLIALLGLLHIPGFFDWLLGQAREALPQAAAGQAEQVIEQIRGNSQAGALSFGLLAAVWVASTGFRALMKALNAAYDVDEKRPAWRRYALSIAYTVALAALVILATVLMQVGPQWLSALAEPLGLGGAFVTLWTWLRVPLALGLILVAVSVIYYVAPNVDQPFRLVSPGALIALAGWLLASLGFSFYVDNVKNYGLMYGSLGAVIVLLIYLFLSATVLLFGAEVNATLYKYAQGGRAGRNAEEKLFDQAKQTVAATRR